MTISPLLLGLSTQLVANSQAFLEAGVWWATGYTRAKESFGKHTNAKGVKSKRFLSGAFNMSWVDPNAVGTLAKVLEVKTSATATNVALITYWLGGTSFGPSRVYFIVDRLKDYFASSFGLSFDDNRTLLPWLYPVFSNYGATNVDQPASDRLYLEHFSDLRDSYRLSSKDLKTQVKTIGSVPINFEYSLREDRPYLGVLSCTFDFKKKKCLIQRKETFLGRWYSYFYGEIDSYLVVRKALQTFRARYAVDVSSLVNDGFQFETKGNNEGLLFKAGLIGGAEPIFFAQKLNTGFLDVAYDPINKELFISYEKSLARKIFEEMQYWIFGKNTAALREIDEAWKTGIESISNRLRISAEDLLRQSSIKIVATEGVVFERAGIAAQLVARVTKAKQLLEKEGQEAAKARQEVKDKKQALTNQLEDTFSMTHTGSLVKLENNQSEDSDPNKLDADYSFAPAVYIKVPETIPDCMKDPKALVDFVTGLGVYEIRVLNEKSKNEEFVSELLRKLKALKYHDKTVKLAYYDYGPTKALGEDFLAEHVASVTIRTIGYNNPNIAEHDETIKYVSPLTHLETNISRQAIVPEGGVWHLDLKATPFTFERLACTIYNFVFNEVARALLIQTVLNYKAEIGKGNFRIAFNYKTLIDALALISMPFTLGVTLLLTVPVKFVMIIGGVAYLRWVKAHETLFDDGEKINSSRSRFKMLTPRELMLKNQLQPKKAPAAREGALVEKESSLVTKPGQQPFEDNKKTSLTPNQ